MWPPPDPNAPPPAPQSPQYGWYPTPGQAQPGFAGAGGQPFAPPTGPPVGPPTGSPAGAFMTPGAPTGHIAPPPMGPPPMGTGPAVTPGNAQPYTPPPSGVPFAPPMGPPQPPYAPGQPPFMQHTIPQQYHQHAHMAPTGPPTGPPTAGPGPVPFGTPSSPVSPNYGNYGIPPGFAAAPMQTEYQPPAPTGPPPAGLPPPPSQMNAPPQAEPEIPFQSLSLQRPALGPNAGKLAGVEQFPRASVEEFVDAPSTQSVSIGNTPIKPSSTAHMRSTMRVVPNSAALLQKWGLPFGAILHPMAKTQEELPLVNFAQLGNFGVIRCRRCRTYINPYVQFTDGGRRWNCSICKQPNDVPQEYFAALDANGVRRDIATRPELTHASCEFVAPPEYMVRPPQRPSYVFVIDVSQTAVNSGLVATAAAALKDCLTKLPEFQDRTQVGIITFDSSVHFYNLKSTLTTAKMIVMPELTFAGGTRKEDVDDIAIPLPDDLVVTLQDSMTVIEDLLERLPTMFQRNENVEVAYGPALSAAIKLLANIGGKIVTFSSGIPSIGVGRLRNRDDKALYGKKQEQQLLVCAEEWYKERALICSREQICIDVFLASQHYTDVVTIGQLAKYTGGQIRHYRSLTNDKSHIQSGLSRLTKDVHRLLLRETGWEAVMRIRSSVQVKITTFYGHFYVRGQDLLALPNIDEDKAFGISLAHVPNQVLANMFCLQAALLYTSSRGERRIRVHTINLPTTGNLADLYRNVDLSASFNLSAKIAVDTVLTSNLENARNVLVDRAITTIRSFRSCLPAQHRNQVNLLLPDSLRLLPLLTLALLRSGALRQDTEVPPDERMSAMSLIMTTPPSGTLRLFLPRAFNITRFISEPDVVPQLEHPSQETLDSEGIYVVDLGTHLVVWVGRRCSPVVLQQLFGVADVMDAQVVLRTPQTQHVVDFIEGIQINAVPSLFPTVVVIRQGAPFERPYLLRFFVEDEMPNTMSYPNFLCHVHRRIQATREA
eukprot:TRINITY_DN10113_c0_g1_i1.p1 TRINITY_DN10113_c0_g1~~TRINITY_DN10113_c0_g1_i1.p1  ORF type:complete len:1008 (-),score=117.50 TRINITY_DN10113_c0_g1_i1:166-3153(-)